MALGQASQNFHPLPVIGYPEEFYLKHVRDADLMGDAAAHSGWKVGQYVTLAVQPGKSWEERLKCFRHTLKHHCVAPPGADAKLAAFYGKLAELVRRHASQEAVRAVMHEHHGYAQRVQGGTPRGSIRSEAQSFFAGFCGPDGKCPEWLSAEAWKQICGARAQWLA